MPAQFDHDPSFVNELTSEGSCAGWQTAVNAHCACEKPAEKGGMISLNRTDTANPIARQAACHRSYRAAITAQLLLRQSQTHRAANSNSQVPYLLLPITLYARGRWICRKPAMDRPEAAPPYRESDPTREPHSSRRSIRGQMPIQSGGFPRNGDSLSSGSTIGQPRWLEPASCRRWRDRPSGQ
jgi:hypothetical protein